MFTVTITVEVTEVVVVTAAVHHHLIIVGDVMSARGLAHTLLVSIKFNQKENFLKALFISSSLHRSIFFIYIFRTKILVSASRCNSAVVFQHFWEEHLQESVGENNNVFVFKVCIIITLYLYPVLITGRY
jgi:hypothetical protein